MESHSEANHKALIKLEKKYDTACDEKEVLTKRVEELKIKIDESLEQNERLSDELNTKCDKYETLVKENENLLSKIDQLECTGSKLEKEYDSLLEDHEKLKTTHGVVCNNVDSLNDIIAKKEKEIFELKDEYRIFKDEYRKLSQHKEELDKDVKDSLLSKFNSMSAECDALKEANQKMIEELAEKKQTIVVLEAEIEKIKAESDETNLNETHIVASGSSNKTNVILVEENKKLRDDVEQ